MEFIIQLFQFHLPGPIPNPYLKEKQQTNNEDSESSSLLINHNDDFMISSSSLSSSSSIQHFDEVSINHYNRKIVKEYDIETTYDHFYLNVYRKENICLIASYFSIGFTMAFISTPMSYYLVHDINASSTQLGVLGTLIGLPWSFKIFYGLLSDVVPIYGYRRKSYFIIGWLIFVIANLSLACLSKPNINQCIIGGFSSMFGILLADVCTDTMCVERAKLESEKTKGSLQSTGYTTRALGGLFGAILGALVYNKDTWGWGLTISQVFTVNIFIPLICIFPTFYNLVELSPIELDFNLKAQLNEVWKTLQLKAVWLPMSYVYLYNVLQIPNSAWGNYLVTGLHFTDFDLGLLGISGSLMTWLGLIVYKRYFFETGWRNIYIFTTVLGVIFSLLQLVLIYRYNIRMGLPDVVFALGDSTLAAFVGSIQFLPTCIMYVSLCPDGSEGTTYALLTTISNLAGTVSSDFGSWCTKIWNVSNES